MRSRGIVALLGVPVTFACAPSGALAQHGFSAVPGYELATGLGTALVFELAGRRGDKRR